MSSLGEKALQKIGRNVVGLQKIELLLKTLVSLSKIEGNSSDIDQRFESRKGSIDKMTLGTVTREYFENLHSESCDDTKFPDDDVYISLKFRFDMKEEDVSSFQEFHKELVEERNHLIHGKLAYFDPSSSDMCLDLIDDLDTQYDRIAMALRSLRTQLRAVLDLRSKARKWIEEEFDRILREED
tara:strand:+ start:164 stop:715 length:552 start_codon:yes stop_codon:yes gene_type:complete